jgi:DNA-binding transcriptional LysR family regulator
MDEALMNIRHLRAVAAIVRSGSVTGAARLVSLTQPAVTQGVAKLERHLGLPLFERAPGGMVPTEAGRMLAARAEAALRLIASPRVTATQMRAFLALARTGSYAAAAAQTGLGEASLHRAVADLAVGLGHRLADRRGRGIALTQRGQSVARMFGLAEAELRSAVAELAALEGREVGRISIGAMPLSRARLLPNAVAAFHNAHPQTEIAIVEGSHAELVGPLRDGDIDLMVGALRDPSPGDDLHQQPLFVDRPVILARSGHPLAGRVSLGPEDLTRFGWIVPAEGTPLRRQWRLMFDAAGLETPSVPIECGSVIMVRQLLVQSDFLTLLSPDQVAVELEAGWLVRVADAPGEISRTIGITTRADWRPTRLQQGFITALETEAAAISRSQQ